MSTHYFYSETAFHHEGDIDFAKELITASKNSGASGIKFQVLVQPDAFLSTRHSSFKALSGYCFSAEQWRELFSFSSHIGLDIIMMPLDPRSMDLASAFSIKYLDIHPVSFYDMPLWEQIRKLGIPVIIGVGGRTPDEIQMAVDYFGDQLAVLMVGFQAFPSDLKDIKLKRIAALRKRYPHIQIGYADHSAFNHDHAVVSSSYARLLGASVFEKHITTKEGIERVDYSAAVSPEKIAAIIANLKFLDEFVVTSQGDLFEFSAPEIKYRERQKKVVATDDLVAGTVLSGANLTTKMIDREGGFFRIPDVEGKILQTPVKKDDMIDTSSLQP
jgi:sialic acid synthase SpsE